VSDFTGLTPASGRRGHLGFKLLVAWNQEVATSNQKYWSYRCATGIQSEARFGNQV